MKTKKLPCKGGCKELDSSKYSAWGGCATDYCGGWNEYHCLKCGWFSSECACGSCNGVSKISSKAEKTIRNKKMAKIMKAKENANDRI